VSSEKNAEVRTRARGFSVIEKTLDELARALESGEVTSVELVAAYLNRIGFFDRHGITLNAVVVLNPEVFADARASDERRARGKALGPLDGIPYTAKDSYKVKGLTVAAGSPAFADLVATDDAFTIAQLRAAGAVLIGLTNMPPMANGGMQRGFYGRAESPYNADFLTAAFGSGSSNGSGTATAASFGAFGLGEETWSSGRAPASNNGLCAYTPSRGVISTRGNWPLVPTMDVVVPHTRTMADMLAILEIIVADDVNPRGDFWRMQPWVATPPSSKLRPASYPALANLRALEGKRIAVPRMYINGGDDAAAAPLPDPIETRESIIELWRAARADLESLGAVVVETDFDVVTRYEDKAGADGNLVVAGFLPPGYAEHELNELCMWSWNDFLTANAEASSGGAKPEPSDLASIHGERIFPQPKGALPDQYANHVSRYSPEDVFLESYVTRARTEGITPLEQIADIKEGIRGLEAARVEYLEKWMTAQGFDAVVFPAVGDVGPADMDVNPASAELGWRNGTWVANGNVVLRHLGIPTVTTPMGVMADIGMPVGLTFAGRAYDDANLLALASTFDSFRNRRMAAPRTPELGACVWKSRHGVATSASEKPLRLHASASAPSNGFVTIHVELETAATEVLITVNGVSIDCMLAPNGFSAVTQVPEFEHTRVHSEWRGGYGSLVVALARKGSDVVGDFAVVGGVA
jgi:amidase